MVATTIEYDFEKAAAFVARGNELEAAAAKTKIPFEDLKEYTEDYADDWNRLIKSERGLMLGQAGAEALTVLRKLIRDCEEKTQVAAATILMKFWMTTLRHDKSDKGGNAFEILEGGREYSIRLEAEEKLEAELAARNALESAIAIPEIPVAEEPPCVVPETVEAEVAVEVPGVPEKPVRLDEAEMCPFLNQNRSGLLAYERYERRPLSHDRGGGQLWERSATFLE